MSADLILRSRAYKRRANSDEGFNPQGYVRRCRLSNFGSRLVERKRSIIDKASETRDRSRRRRLEHFERAARQFTLQNVSEESKLRSMRASLSEMTTERHVSGESHTQRMPAAPQTPPISFSPCPAVELLDSCCRCVPDRSYPISAPGPPARCAGHER